MAWYLINGHQLAIVSCSADLQRISTDSRSDCTLKVNYIVAGGRRPCGLLCWRLQCRLNSRGSTRTCKQGACDASFALAEERLGAGRWECRRWSRKGWPPRSQHGPLPCCSAPLLPCALAHLVTPPSPSARYEAAQYRVHRLQEVVSTLEGRLKDQREETAK